jgi:oxygen-independent coproporphyrinogen-3 oxidase
LTLETGTPMGRRFADGDVELPGEDERYDFFMTTSERLEKEGYIHYEVSNFARREMFRSRHNMKYWNHVTYLGLGPSAHSFSGNRRWWNHASLERYISDLEQNRRPVEETEILTDRDLRLERVFLGLRTMEGISASYPVLLEPPGSDILRQCLADGLLERRAGRIAPTRRGLALADQLAVLL